MGDDGVDDRDAAGAKVAGDGDTPATKGDTTSTTGDTAPSAGVDTGAVHADDANPTKAVDSGETPLGDTPGHTSCIVGG